MSNTDMNTKNILIQQCNYWFSQFKKLEKYKDINNSENLMIEALGCAKGTLCALLELDKENKEKYESFIKDINYKLELIYKKRIKFQSKYNSLSYNKMINKTLFN